MKELSVKENIEIRSSDLAELSQKYHKPMFTAFLNEQEQYYAENYIRLIGCDCRFWGGDDCCTRKMLGFFPDEGTYDFPIFPITVTYRKADKLTHRDFLGSFLSLGINRDQIGDILIDEGYAVVFCTKTSYDLISGSVSKIGRVGVNVYDGVKFPIPEPKFEEIEITVSSLRLDCIVSSVSGLSREKTADFVRSGYAALNYEENTNISKQISAGDILSLRGFGKYTVLDGVSETKKGKLRIRLKKFS